MVIQCIHGQRNTTVAQADINTEVQESKIPGGNSSVNTLGIFHDDIFSQPVLHYKEKKMNKKFSRQSANHTFRKYHSRAQVRKG